MLFQGHFSMERVTVGVVEQSQRKVDQNMELALLKQWDKTLHQARESGVKAWDSTIYRYETGEVYNTDVHLTFSRVPFSIMRSARYYVQELKQLGPAYFPHGIFVSVIVKTSDEHYIRVKISSHTLNAGIYDLVGGVASEHEVRVNSSHDLFQIAYNELEEELGIEKDKIKDIYLLGAIASTSLNISLVFHADLSITRNEVVTCFKTKNDGEVEHVEFLSRDQFIAALEEMGSYKSKIPNLLKELP